MHARKCHCNELQTGRRFEVKKTESDKLLLLKLGMPLRTNLLDIAAWGQAPTEEGNAIDMAILVVSASELLKKVSCTSTSGMLCWKSTTRTVDHEVTFSKISYLSLLYTFLMQRMCKFTHYSTTPRSQNFTTLPLLQANLHLLLS